MFKNLGGRLGVETRPRLANLLNREIDYALRFIDNQRIDGIFGIKTKIVDPIGRGIFVRVTNDKRAINSLLEQ